MNRFLSISLVLFLMLSIFQCQTREDDSLDKAIFTYALLCQGGSLAACQQGCADRYPNVTGENFTAVDSCLSSCSSNCNIQNIYLLLEAQ